MERLDTVVEPPLGDDSDQQVAFAWSEGRGWHSVGSRLAEETSVTIYLDQIELVTLMCTPGGLNFLVAGFLRSEGLIERLDDIAMMRVCPEDPVVDVRLVRPRSSVGKRVLTSGCGGGVTFDEGAALSPVVADLRVTPTQLLDCMKLMQHSHGGRGGLHAAALSDGETLLVAATDIGRHNTLDKIWGECLFQDIQTEGRVLLSTGRLSSEMLVKTARMGVPIAVSLNSPTGRAVQLAERLNISVVGYARGSRLTVYSHPERFQPSPSP